MSITLEEKDNQDDYLVCWSCDENVSYFDLSYNDGFCPYCKAEIDLDEY